MIEILSRTSGHDRTTALYQANDGLEAVAPHLTLLRDSLARDTAHDQRGHVPPRRRTPAPSAARLTLPQWVSKTKHVG
ncbi:hypothetical protein ACWDFL_15430 [Streptomyces bungoensis]